MRLSFIDTAKFLAILFVVIGHCGVTNLSIFLYAFHVQLFFIVYGFVYTKKNLQVTEFIKKSVKRILVPYVLVYLILSTKSLPIGLINMLYGSRESLEHVSHLWFLPSFFMSCVFFFVLMNKLQGSYRYFLLSIIFVLGYITRYEVELPVHLGCKVYYLTGMLRESSDSARRIGMIWGINASFVGTILMYLGYLLRQLYNRYKSKIHDHNIIICIISLIIGLSLFYINQSYIPSDFSYGFVALANAVYGNYLLFIVVSVVITVAILCLSLSIDNQIFSRYGRETMAIYAFHPVFIGLVGKYLPPIMGGG